MQNLIVFKSPSLADLDIPDILFRPLGDIEAYPDILFLECPESDAAALAPFLTLPNSEPAISLVEAERTVVDRLFYKMLALIGIFFLALLAYRFVAGRLYSCQ